MVKKETQIKSIERMKKHGEVFTASKEVKSMLSLIEDEFDTPEKCFLEPACGDGNFLTGILKKKLEKTKNENDILSALKSIYGIDLLKDNILTAEKRLLEQCFKHYKTLLKKEPDKSFSDKIKSILKNNLKQGDFLTDNFFKNIKFCAIVGNPPYQIIDGGGTGDSAKPVYNLFIERAKSLNPEHILMIIPSRWMKGGKGLSKFRENMINDKQIKILYDFENGKICFPDLHIDGGVCYFLLSKNYNGMTEYHHFALDGTRSITKRFLKNKFTDTVIRDYRQISIIEKALMKEEEKFSSIVLSRNPFGFYADLFNSPERYREIKVYDNYCDNLYKIYGVKGKKGGAKRITGYISPSLIRKNKSSADKYKLFFSKAYTTTSTIPPEIIFAGPEEVCTETFLQVGCFDTKKEAENCLKYMQTNFFRALLFFNRHSLNISKKSFNLIPLQDFTKEWNDDKLYKKYGFEQKEIDFINSVIRSAK